MLLIMVMMIKLILCACFIGLYIYIQIKIDIFPELLTRFLLHKSFYIFDILIRQFMCVHNVSLNLSAKKN